MSFPVIIQMKGKGVARTMEVKVINLRLSTCGGKTLLDLLVWPSR